MTLGENPAVISLRGKFDGADAKRATNSGKRPWQPKKRGQQKEYPANKYSNSKASTPASSPAKAAVPSKSASFDKDPDGKVKPEAGSDLPEKGKSNNGKEKVNEKSGENELNEDKDADEKKEGTKLPNGGKRSGEPDNSEKVGEEDANDAEEKIVFVKRADTATVVEEDLLETVDCQYSTLAEDYLNSIQEILVFWENTIKSTAKSTALLNKEKLKTSLLVEDMFKAYEDEEWKEKETEGSTDVGKQEKRVIANLSEKALSDEKGIVEETLAAYRAFKRGMKFDSAIEQLLDTERQIHDFDPFTGQIIIKKKEIVKPPAKKRFHTRKRGAKARLAPKKAMLFPNVATKT